MTVEQALLNLLHASLGLAQAQLDLEQTRADTANRDALCDGILAGIARHERMQTNRRPS